MAGELERSDDVPTGRVVPIPARELPPGAVRATVAGVGGPVRLPPVRVTAGAIRHAELDDATRAAIRAIHATFAEHDFPAFDAWEEGFRRDADPAAEVALWRRAAEVYREFAAGEAAADRRRAVFRCLVACLASSAETVGPLLEPGPLTRAELGRIAGRFFGGGDR